MENFIFMRIKEASTISEDAGKEKYAAYFVKLSYYEKYRAAVNQKLTEAGLSGVIQ